MKEFWRDMRLMCECEPAETLMPGKPVYVSECVECGKDILISYASFKAGQKLPCRACEDRTRNLPGKKK